MITNQYLAKTMPMLLLSNRDKGTLVYAGPHFLLKLPRTGAY